MKKLLSFLVASTVFTGTAQAQSLTDTIIVTARKTEETIQQTPVSVRYYGQSDLESRNAVNLTDLNGFNQRSIPQNADGFILSLRGQAQNDVSVTVDPSVGTYVDGVYIGRGYGLNSTLLDVKNVQILSGPQGTLFGRNTTGGAVLIQTNDPVVGRFGIDGTLSYGRFNEVIASSTVNVPLANGLAIRASGLTVQRDGFTTDRITGKKYNDRETYQGRVKLLYDTGSIQTVISGEYYQNSGGLSPRFMTYGYGNLAALATPNPGDTVALDNGMTNETEVTSVSMSNTIGNFKLTSGYRRVETFYSGDFDGTPQNIYNLTNTADVEQYTSEAQYTGRLGRNNYILGAFYFEEKGSETGRASLYGGLSTSQTGGNVHNKSYGAFIHNTLNITDQLALNAGVRYTHDVKTITTYNGYLRPNGTLLACFSAETTTAKNCNLFQTASFDNWSWSAGLDYKINSDHLIYVKAGTGYKSGGNQIRAISVNSDRLQFDPERITEYEIGYKGSIGNTLQYSIAGFYNEVENMQVLSVLTQPTVYTLVKNAARARNFGAEAQVRARVTPNLTLNATGAWIDPKFLEYRDPVSGADLRTNRFNNVTEFQFTAGADYYIDRFGFSANYVWMGKTDKLSTPYNTLVARYGQTNGTKIYNTTVIPSYGTLNLRATYATDYGTFAVWGRNVLDKRIEKDMTPLEGLFNTTTYNDPATFGVSYSFSF